MPIQMVCEHCGHTRPVNERLAGRRIRCPKCERAITLPTLAADETAVVEQTPDVGPVVAETVAFAAVPSRPGIAAESSGPTDRNGFSRSSALASELASAVAVLEAPAVATHTTRTEHETDSSDDFDEDAPPPRKKRDDGELDMTPMVDVTFLLLIFFMVTASFSLQKSIQMPKQTSDLPSSAQPEEPTEELDPIELEIDENGSFLVLAQEWDREAPGKQNLVSTLREAIGNNKDGMKLNIKVHENAKLQFLVDGMDAGTIAGFAELQVTEVDSFD